MPLPLCGFGGGGVHIALPLSVGPDNYTSFHYQKFVLQKSESARARKLSMFL